ncbi:hypothetical protein L2E82_05663 [Cichorium intybus]|uniref:Uncharacterized protein n=1 Tax=Cichorium intybus TaxID=13427 RepID=A0ACB9H8Y9_CICIN|nr:hypothetical protein L2E82_05663 [Cichorium intybus]
MKAGPAEKPNNAMQLLRIMWTDVMKLPKDKIDGIMEDVITINERYEKRSSILFVAAKMGNTEFVVELIRQYPDLVWKRNHRNRTIFHFAVKERHEGIYNLLHEIGSMKDTITRIVDSTGDNMLHLVGRMPKEDESEEDSGVGLQVKHMQREVLWFKEVNDMVPPPYREMKNRQGLTPHQLFKRSHQRLLDVNEKWVKDTSNQCLVAATLIASIGFAAAFAVPGPVDLGTSYYQRVDFLANHFICQTTILSSNGCLSLNIWF